MGATAGLGGHGVIQFYDETTAGSGTFVTKRSAVTNDADTGTIIFIENASAGTANFTNEGGTRNLAGGGVITFAGQSSAAQASFVNHGSTNDGLAGFISFHDNSTAGSASFINNGGDRQASIWFYDQATAGNATFTSPTAEGLGGGIQFYGISEAGSASFNLDDGSVTFWESSSAANATINLASGSVLFGTTSTAANATIIATGGEVIFIHTATGGSCRIELLGSSSLDLSNREASSTTIGSLEGSAVAFLGQYNLTIGSNDLSTTFSGLLRDGGIYGGKPGSITKIGTGTLTLSNANVYTGGTTVEGGTLLVKNITGSATGTGAVQVSGGILGGRGIISGATTIGSGGGSGGSLQPGKGASNPTTLGLQSSLTFKSDGTYTWKLNTKRAQADQVVANGVTIESGAQFDFNAVGNKRLTTGTSFIPISNTSTGAINGTFANLPDGSIVVVGANKLQVSYQAGDGNDLTLTVVP
jgi:autotransporter-associated beta strand protein